jgi:hypothetical protein
MADTSSRTGAATRLRRGDLLGSDPHSTVLFIPVPSCSTRRKFFPFSSENAHHCAAVRMLAVLGLPEAINFCRRSPDVPEEVKAVVYDASRLKWIHTSHYISPLSYGFWSKRKKAASKLAA